MTERGTAGHAEIGVLGLQGDFGAHARALEDLGVRAHDVRRPHDLEGLRGLVLPGGESTALLRLLDFEPEWWRELVGFHDRGGVLLGTCAGIILLARDVTGPSQRSLGLLDVTVARNAYGRQVDSFEARAAWTDGSPLDIVCIRAPRITRVGPGVEVLASHRGEPVLVGSGRVFGATFHPELTSDRSLQRTFLAACEAAETSTAKSSA